MLYEVILDSGETPNKCTIAPLSYRSDFHISRVTNVLQMGPFSAGVLLHPDGLCLTELRASLGSVNGIAAIDCIWRRLEGLVRRVKGPLPPFAKIPDGFVTAYPRRSSYNLDPEEGLATIEALFIASAILGNWDISLLSHYYFGRKFVQLNATRFQELGVEEASDSKNYPVEMLPIRNSQSRRRNRQTVVLKD